LTVPRPPASPLFPYTTLFRSIGLPMFDFEEWTGSGIGRLLDVGERRERRAPFAVETQVEDHAIEPGAECRSRAPACRIEPHAQQDRKSTRLNSSHQIISYAVF